MHTEKLIIKGTPEQFLALVDSIDSLMALRRPPGTPLPDHYVFGPYQPLAGPKGAWQSPDLIKVLVEIHPPGWQNIPIPFIEATSLPDNRTRLVLWCEETGWPEVEPFWNELKDELQRLGVLFDEDKTETMTTTITMHKIQEQHLDLICSVATFLGVMETYIERLTLSSSLPPYEVTQKSEQSAVILVWPEPGRPDRKAKRLGGMGDNADREKAGLVTVQAGPTAGCKVILSYTDLTWPAIEKSWQMLEATLWSMGYISDAPTAAEPQAEPEPEPERPKVPRGRKTELTPDAARAACKIYQSLQKKVTQQEIADALGLALGTFQGYWEKHKKNEL